MHQRLRYGLEESVVAILADSFREFAMLADSLRERWALIDLPTEWAKNTPVETVVLVAWVSPQVSHTDPPSRGRRIKKNKIKATGSKNWRRAPRSEIGSASIVMARKSPTNIQRSGSSPCDRRNRPGRLSSSRSGRYSRERFWNRAMQQRGGGGIRERRDELLH
jgi:hypothetical protein